MVDGPVRPKSLSQKASGAVGDEGTREMQHRQIVLGLLLPAHQDPAEAVQPTMRSRDPPPTCPLGGFPLHSDGGLAPARHVRGIAELLGQLPHLVEVQAFVQTETLRFLGRGFGLLDVNVLERLARPLVAGTVGPRDGDGQGTAPSVGPPGALRAALAAVLGTPTGFPPRPPAPW